MKVPLVHQCDEAPAIWSLDEDLLWGVHLMIVSCDEGAVLEGFFLLFLYTSSILGVLNSTMVPTEREINQLSPVFAMHNLIIATPNQEFEALAAILKADLKRATTA